MPFSYKQSINTDFDRYLSRVSHLVKSIGALRLSLWGSGLRCSVGWILLPLTLGIVRVLTGCTLRRSCWYKRKGGVFSPYSYYECRLLTDEANRWPLQFVQKISCYVMSCVLFPIFSLLFTACAEKCPFLRQVKHGMPSILHYSLFCINLTSSWSLCLALHNDQENKDPRLTDKKN